jgi:hypothetical protein
MMATSTMQHKAEGVRGTPDKMSNQHNPGGFDPGHLVVTVGGLAMLAVVGLCSSGLAAPWWTDSTETPVHKSLVEVSLWTRYTRMEFSQNAASLDCTSQCDITMKGAKTVREFKDKWTSVCREAKEDMVDKCNKLWAVRVLLLCAWFCAIMYVFSAFLAFLGAGNPASCRPPASALILLSICYLLTSIVALGIAGNIDVTLKAVTPGTVPRDEVGTSSVSLNGTGFTCALVALFVSLVGIAIAFLNQTVMDSMHKFWEFENGRALADPKGDTGPDKAPKKPPSKAINAWVV